MTLLFNQGTVTTTSGSNAITFVGAGLLPMQAQHGDEIVIGGTYSGFLDTVDHAAQTATVNPPFIGTTGAGKLYTIRRATPISVSASEALERTFKLLNGISVFDSEGIGLLYTFANTTTVADPGVQKIALNNTNLQSVTRLSINVNDAKGKNVDGLLGSFRNGYAIVVRSVETGSYAAYRVMADTVVTGGFANLLVSYIDHDGYFVTGEPLVVGFAVGVDTALVDSWGIPSTHVINNYLRRNAANTGMEYRTPAEVLADIAAEPARSTVSQTDAEAGTSTSTRGWTALRVAQAVDARALTGKILNKTAAYTIVKADQGSLVQVNSATAVTISLTAAATLASGFIIGIKNIGTGTITIDPSGSELIEGSATYTLTAREGCVLSCTGTNFQIVSQYRIDGSDLTGLSKTQVGLSNVDNTSDVNKPVSTAQATAIATKEPLRTTVTQAIAEAGADANVYAWTSQRVRQAAAAAIAAWIGTAPAALDTLDELAAAIADDANFATTMTTLIGTKLNASAVSSFILTLLDDADASTARATLGAEPARTGVSQAGAEAGTSTTTVSWTPQRVAQAIAALPSKQFAGGDEIVVTASGSIVAANNGKIIVVNSATSTNQTLAAPATLGAGWIAVISALGDGDVIVNGTFDNGETSVTLSKGGSMIVQSNGSVHRTLLRGGGAGGGGSGVALPSRETIVGNGSATYTLNKIPPSEESVLFFIGGSLQGMNSFSLASNTVVFDEPVPAGMLIESYVLRSTAYLGVNPVYRRTNGTGSAGPFSLMLTPYSPEALDIFVGGILQPKVGAYTVTAGSITFSEGIPATTYWEEMHIQPITIGVPNPESISEAEIKTAAVPALRGKLGVDNLSGYRNKFINGDWVVAQRASAGTIAIGATGFAGDRWIVYNNTNQSLTWDIRLVASGSTLMPKAKLAMAITFATAPTTGAIQVFQKIEGLRHLVGDSDASYTLTGYFRAPATTSLVGFVGENFGTGGSPSTAVYPAMVSSTDVTVLTTRQKRSVVLTVPNVINKNYGTNNDDHLVAGWQLAPRAAGVYYFARMSFVEGDATAEDDPFSPRHFHEEQALCYRYFFRLPGTGQEVLPSIGYNAQSISVPIKFPVAMRVNPVITTDMTNANYSAPPSASQWGFALSGREWAQKTTTPTISFPVDRFGCAVLVINGTITICNNLVVGTSLAVINADAEL